MLIIFIKCVFIKYFSVTFMHYHSFYGLSLLKLLGYARHSYKDLVNKIIWSLDWILMKYFIASFTGTSCGHLGSKVIDDCLFVLSSCYIFMDEAQAENQKQSSFGLTLSGFLYWLHFWWTLGEGGLRLNYSYLRAHY